MKALRGRGTHDGSRSRLRCALRSLLTLYAESMDALRDDADDIEFGDCMAGSIWGCNE